VALPHLWDMAKQVPPRVELADSERQLWHDREREIVSIAASVTGLQVAPVD